MEQKSQLKKSTDGIAAVDVILPNYSVALWLHELRLPSSSTSQKAEAVQKLMVEIERDEMLPLYTSLCEEFSWPISEALVEKLTIANDNEQKALAAALQEAEENFGDVEVKDAILSEAHFYCRIGRIDDAIKRYEAAHQKTVGAGSKLDVTLTLVRLGLLYGRRDITLKNLEKSKIDCEKGGDWERRNKLKIYEAFYLAQNRKFTESTKLLLDCIAIFTASELISFESFIFTTVLLSMISLDRPALKKQVMASPEVSQVLAEDPILKDFLHSYFYCDYKTFMNALVDITMRVKRDFFLNKHMRYFVRVIRFKAYRQFLEPYRSVTISSMAEAFSCSSEFIEADVADYISNGKLNCSIDRVSGVIRCTRQNPTSVLHGDIVKQGDLLLSKIQKLSKIIDM